MEANEIDNFWEGFPLVHRDPETRAGEPVLKGTRLTPNALVENVEAFIELRGMSEPEAVQATLKQFPGVPGGAETIRQLLAYQESHTHELHTHETQL
jgi:uncharacterized protein (DUF433 family)